MGEQDYLNGTRAVYRELLATALNGLDYDQSDATPQRWILEREAAIAQLRMLCAEHGDNDWDETLRLADIIDKHLGRYLDAEAGT